MFNDFHKRLSAQGLIANKGKVVDATIVKAPIQRNSKKENEQIKNGEQITEWKNKTKTGKRIKMLVGLKNMVDLAMVIKTI